MRRIPDNVDLPCPECGYNLRGLIHERGFLGKYTGARCPECARECDLWEMYSRKYRTRLLIEELLRDVLWPTAAMVPFIVAFLIMLIFGRRPVTPVIFFVALGLSLPYHLGFAARALEALGGDWKEQRFQTVALAVLLSLFNVLLICMVALK